MAVVGSAEIVVRAITNKVKGDIQKGFREARPAIKAEGQAAHADFLSGFGKGFGKDMGELLKQGLANPEIDAAAGRSGTRAGRSFNNGMSAEFSNIDTSSIASHFNESMGDIEDAARDAGRKASDSFEREMSSGGRRGGNSFSKGFLDSGWAQGAMQASKAFTIMLGMGNLVAPAIASLVGAISSLVSGLFAMAAAAGQAVGALGVLPGAIGVAIQGMGALKLAMSGVGAAMSAGFKGAAPAVKSTGTAARDAATAVADAQKALGRAQADAARQIADARQAVSRAYADAASAAADASRKVADALDEERSANAELLQAQRDMNVARKEAVEQLQQLAFSAEDAALGEERAGLRLEDAHAKLVAAQSLPVDDRARREAELGFKEAELAFREAKDRNSDTAKEAKKAAKAGVDGTEVVVSARNKVRDAEEKVRDAIISVGDARRDQQQQEIDSAQAIGDAQQSLAQARLSASRSIADAEEALAKAHQRVADAAKGSTTAADNYAAALDKLSKPARKFVTYMVSLEDEFKELKTAAGADLFGKLIKAMKGIVANVFPILQKELRVTGKHLGNAALGFSAVFDPKKKNRLGQVLKGNNEILAVFTKRGEGGENTVSKLTRLFLRLLTAVQPVTLEFSKWIAGLISAKEKTTRSGAAMEELQKKFHRAGRRAALLGDIFKNVWHILGDLARAADPAGKDLLESFERVTRKKHNFLKKDKNQDKLIQFFKDAAWNVKRISHLLGVASEELLGFGDNKGVGKLAKGLEPAVKKFGDIGDRLITASPALGDFADEIAILLGHLTQTSQIQKFIDTLTFIVHWINKIIHGLGVFFNWLDKIIKKFTAFIGFGDGLSNITGKIGLFVLGFFAVHRAVAFALRPIAFFFKALVGGPLKVLKAFGNIGKAFAILRKGGGLKNAFAALTGGSDKAKNALERQMKTDKLKIKVLKKLEKQANETANALLRVKEGGAPAAGAAGALAAAPGVNAVDDARVQLGGESAVPQTKKEIKAAQKAAKAAAKEASAAAKAAAKSAVAEAKVTSDALAKESKRAAKAASKVARDASKAAVRNAKRESRLLEKEARDRNKDLARISRAGAVGAAATPGLTPEAAATPKVKFKDRLKAKFSSRKGDQRGFVDLTGGFKKNAKAATNAESTIKKSTGKIGGSMKTLGKSGGAAGKGAKLLGKGFGGIGKGMAVMGGPLGIILLLMPIFIALFKKLYKNSPAFRKFVDGIVDKLKELGKWFNDKIMPIIEKFFEWVNKNLPKVGKFFGKVFGAIGNAIGAFVGFVRKHWKTIAIIIGTLLLGPIGGLVIYVITHFGTIKKKIKEVIDAVKKKFGEFKAKIADVVLGVRRFLAKLEFKFALLKFKIAMVINSIKKKFEELKDKIKKVIVDFITTKINNFKRNMDTLKDKIHSVIEKIKSKFEEFKDKIKKVIVDYITARIETFKANMERLKDKVRDVIDKIKGYWEGLKDKIGKVKDWLDTKIQAIKDKFASIGTAVRDVFNNLGDKARAGINTFIDFLNKNLIGKLNRVTKKFGLTIPEIPRLAEGGPIKGRGGPKEDNHLRALSAGEYVVKASSVRAMGEKNLDYINRYGRPPTGMKMFGIGDVADGIGNVAGAVGGAAADAFGKLPNLGDLQDIYKSGVGKTLSLLIGGAKGLMKQFGFKRGKKGDFTLGGFFYGIMDKLQEKAKDWGHEKDEAHARELARAAAAAALSGSAVGGTGSRGVWLSLRSVGFSAVQAAGIMGNMQSESGFDPHIVQGGGHSMNPAAAGGGGYGLVQWTPGKKLIPYLHGRSPSIGSEIDALKEQLQGKGANGEAAAGAALRAAKTITAATRAFELKYERHAGGPQANRITQAQHWYNMYKGLSISQAGFPGADVGDGGGTGDWRYPLAHRYRITQYPNAGHNPPWSVDIGAPSGTTVLAAASGFIETMRDLGGTSYGRYLRLQHANGVRTLYAHLMKFLVRSGQRVRAGQAIARSNNTGGSTGPHLHFELMPSSNTVSAMRARGVRLATGGIVKATPGGIFANIGEAGRNERVEPLDKQGLSVRDRAMIDLIKASLQQQGGGGGDIHVYPSRGMNEIELANLVSRRVAWKRRAGT